MVGHGNVHVAIVVDVTKVGCPALLIKHQSAFQSFFGPTSLTIIDPKLVDAAGVLRIIDKLTALGDEKIHVTIAVKVGKNSPVIAAVVSVWIVTEIVARQGDELQVVHGHAGLRTFPCAAQGVVVATKGIEYAIIVQVGHVAGLHEHRIVVEFIDFIALPCPEVHQVDAIIASARKDVFGSVIVDVANASTPLVLIADGTIMHGGESRGRLVHHIYVFSLVKENHII